MKGRRAGSTVPNGARKFQDLIQPAGTVPDSIGSRDADFLHQMLYLDTKIFMTSLNLTYNDKMSMASSVEVRVPFLDRELAEFVAWNVPPNMKLKGFLRPTTKYIFRKAMRDILPREVLRQPKAGFAAPVDYWLAHDLKEMVDDLLSSAQLRRRGLFRPEAVQALYRRASQRPRGLVDATLAIPDSGIMDADVSRRRSAAVRGRVTIRRSSGDGMKQVLQHARTRRDYGGGRSGAATATWLRAGAHCGVGGFGGYRARFRRICPQEPAAEGTVAARPGAGSHQQGAA